MLEEDARQLAKDTLERLGSKKGWHKVLVRFGANTIKNFQEPSDRGVRLGTDDIFFLDIGPVWGERGRWWRNLRCRAKSGSGHDAVR